MTTDATTRAIEWIPLSTARSLLGEIGKLKVLGLGAQGALLIEMHAGRYVVDRESVDAYIEAERRKDTL